MKWLKFTTTFVQFYFLLLIVNQQLVTFSYSLLLLTIMIWPLQKIILVLVIVKQLQHYIVCIHIDTLKHNIYHGWSSSGYVDMAQIVH